jgi:diaminopimelate decarboxylase
MPEHPVDEAAAMRDARDRDAALCAVARRFGTPLLVIDERRLREGMREVSRAFARPGWRCDVVYAAKALAVAAITRIAYDEGLLIDACSEGELQTALRSGVPASGCLLHGCAKTDRELELALSSQVAFVVVDHRGEIERLAQIARLAGRRIPVLLRVNVAIAAPTGAQVQTAAPDSKFGFPIDDGQATQAARLVHGDAALDFAGLHCHIGSQISDVGAFSAAVQRLAGFALRLKRETGIQIGVLNAGGGLAAGAKNDTATDPTPTQWADAIFAPLQTLYPDPARRPKILVEPGRCIVGRAGSSLYSIAVRKRLADGSEAVIVDGGMSDNPRPALYDATYPVIGLNPREATPERFVIFGRHCETDLLFRDVMLADPQAGDVLEVRNTGAYTYSMASNYNRFPRPAVVLLDATRARLIARREPIDHLLDLDIVDSTAGGPAE